MLQTASKNIIQIKYFTKALIEQINCQAIVDGRRNCVSPETLEAINAAHPDTLYPVQHHITFEDNVRTQFVLNEKGDTVIFDLILSEWEALPHRDITKPRV